jgi:hypothetical protein
VDDPATGDRQVDIRQGDLRCRVLEQAAVQHHQVRGLPGLDRPGTVLFTAVCSSQSGFGLDTGQSLPKHSCAPDRSRLPNGYCQEERSGPRKGNVSSVI